MKTKSDGTAFISTIIWILVAITILGIAIPSYNSGYDKGYEKGYSSAIEKTETYDQHERSCDGSCYHVESEIEDLVYDGKLIWEYDLYQVVKQSDEYYTEDEHRDALDADSYTQGYEDCYYGYEPAY